MSMLEHCPRQKSLRTNRAAHGKHNLCRDGLPSQQLSNEGNQSTLLIECFIHLPKACRLRLPSKTICPCSRQSTMLKRPAPARPIYQALTHLERYHSLICKMFLRAILIASEHVFDRQRSALKALDEPNG